MSKPKIAITIGEVAGIGPEIVLKSIVEGSILEHCEPVVIGNLGVLERIQGVLGTQVEFRTISDIDEAKWGTSQINLISIDNIPEASYSPGFPNAITGKAMIEYTELAVRLCLEHKVQGAVGGPHSKKAADDAGIFFDGYPGLIAKQTGSRYPFLMLASKNLRVVNTTLHVSVREACNMITKELVLEAIKAGNDAVKTFGITKPKIAVAGLNPHAGEGGMFGDEDEKYISPAVLSARELGIDAHGPLPADSLFFNTESGKYDLYVAMYHDQAHIPVKVLAFKEASAVAIGVPINWATVDHGCALDIAWKNVADASVITHTIKLVSERANSYVEIGK